MRPPPAEVNPTCHGTGITAKNLMKIYIDFKLGSLEEDCRSMNLEIPDMVLSDSDEEDIEEGTPPEPESEPEPEPESESEPEPELEPEPEPENAEVLQVRVSHSRAILKCGK